VESSLELLDLERNRLSNISAAFCQLSGLRYLYLSNNNISEVPEAAFQSFAETLQARGLQLFTFFGISIGIKRRMIDIGKKITIHF
jgi:hypothetical protein